MRFLISLSQSFLKRKKWEEAVRRSYLSLELIHFDDRSITDFLKEKVSIAEADVTRLFQQEQEKKGKSLKKTNVKKGPKLELSPTAKERENIRERLKSEKAKKKLSLIKEKIKHLLTLSPQKNKEKRLESISKLTGIAILSLPRVSLEELGRVKAGKKRLNLLRKDFLESIESTKKRGGNGRVIGPIESGPYSVYARITKVYSPSLPFILSRTIEKKLLTKTAKKSKLGKDTKGKPLQSYNKETDSPLTKKLFDYVVEKEAERAAFKLRHPKS